MQKLLLSAALLLGLATPVCAATASDFYLTLLRRGTADVEAGRNPEAVSNLRLAAFGLLDSIEHYEIAQAYLAIALERSEQTDAAREAVRRIVAAEKIEKKFAVIALPASIRTAFDGVAKKVLPAEAAALMGGATAKPAEPVIVDRVEVVTETAPQGSAKPAKPPQPQPQQKTAKPVEKVPAPQQQKSAKPVEKVPAPQPMTAQSGPAPKVVPAPVPAKPAAPKTTDVGARFTAAERALTSANIAEARTIYRELLAAPGLDRPSTIRLAEGFYRARDFANTLVAFDRLGQLRSGEEPYRYYAAVAAFEVGQVDRARRELAAALPWIEVTPDVQRYRSKIESTR